VRAAARSYCFDRHSAVILSPRANDYSRDRTGEGQPLCRWPSRPGCTSIAGGVNLPLRWISSHSPARQHTTLHDRPARTGSHRLHRAGGNSRASSLRVLHHPWKAACRKFDVDSSVRSWFLISRGIRSSSTIEGGQILYCWWRSFHADNAPEFSSQSAIEDHGWGNRN